MTDNTIAVGESVAPFEADSTGGIVRLADQRGKTLVLYFYPKDSTPGCTTETQEFGDAMPAFEAAGAAVYGVSRDSEPPICSTFPGSFNGVHAARPATMRPSRPPSRLPPL